MVKICYSRVCAKRKGGDLPLKKLIIFGMVVATIGFSLFYFKSQNDFHEDIKKFIHYTAADTLNEYPKDVDVKIQSVDYNNKNPITNIKDYTVQSVIAWDGETKGNANTTWEASTGESFDLQVSCNGCVEENTPDTDSEIAKWNYINDLTQPELKYIRGDISREEADEQIATVTKNKDTYWDENSQDNGENKSQTDEKNNYIKNTNSSHSTKNTEEKITENTPLYTFNMKGVRGAYKLHILSEGIETSTSDLSWAGAEEGDTIQKGTFKALVIDEHNDTQAEFELNSEPMTINKNRNHVFITKGTPSILVFSQTESSSSVAAKLFYIKDGELIEIKGEEEGGYGFLSFLEGAIKYIEPNLYQIFGYNNGVGGWYINDLKIDFTSGKSTIPSWHELEVESGREIYNRWKAEPNYYYYEGP